jgi:integrase
MASRARQIGFEHETILTDAAKSALEKARRESTMIGDAWVFPAPRDASKPVPRYTLIKWWKVAERMAKLPPAKGRGYHSLRRKFATELKKTPLVDLAYLGGYKSPQTVLLVYQKPDERSMRQALEQRIRMGELERTG